MFLATDLVNKTKNAGSALNFLKRSIDFFEKYCNFATDNGGVPLLHGEKKPPDVTVTDIMNAQIHNRGLRNASTQNRRRSRVAEPD